MPKPAVFVAAILAGAVLMPSGYGRADPAYIYGLHDPGGESNMGTHKGWIVWTEAIGTSGSGGKDYSSWSNQGYGVVVRLNNGYSPAGTLPYQANYDAFASRAANYIQNSPGVNYWIIGNECNLAREWPGNGNGDPNYGEPITVARYVDCYNRCYNAIKAAAPAAKLCPTPSGTWGPPLPAQGIDGFLNYWVNILNSIGASRIDGLILHAYTHGCDPALVTNTDLMGPPYQTIYYNFYVYRNYMNAIPAGMRDKPVLITECDQNVECATGSNPAVAWSNVNSGWVRNIYAEINNWNTNNAQTIRCVALFRWPVLPEGGYTFGIADKPLVIQDFQQACAFGYTTTPRISLSPTALSTSTYTRTSPATQSFTVANSGAGALDYSISKDQTWLSVSPTTGTTPPGPATITVTYSTATLDPGTYHATITVSDPNAVNNPQTVSVTLTVDLRPLPDFDDDGDVDQDDFGRFQVCLSGSGNTQSNPACALAQLDADDDVDQTDLTFFLKCMSGAGGLADSACTR